MARPGDHTLPWTQIPGLAAEFRDVDALLLALHQRWYAHFAARLDAMLEDPPGDLPRAVRGLWETLVDEDPVWRAVLDAYRAHPKLAAADERQRQLLSMATFGEMELLPSDIPRADLSAA